LANLVEKFIEKGLFASRWLMAPFYIVLCLTLGALLYSFMVEFYHFITHITRINQTEVVLTILSLIDLSLAGNLMLIVIFSGYENFVSSLDLGNREDQLHWKRTIDFATLKLKLISSIVAISSIHLLRSFMSNEIDEKSLKLRLLTVSVFVFLGVMLAIMDYISSKTKLLKKYN
jgi:uncharacterized protein (TIGR00645 family)